MKLLIVLALVTLATAQMPLPLGYNNMYPGLNADMVLDPTVNPYFINKQQAMFGGNSKYPFTSSFPINTAVPSYGPFIRYGNTIVPIPQQLPFPYGKSPFTPYSPVGPFTPYSSMMGQVPVNTPYFSMGSPNIYNPTGSPSIYNPMMVDPRMGAYSDLVNPYDDESNMISPYGSIEGGRGFTPYSQAALFNMITRGGVGKMDLYSKLILGRTTGLSRKMKEVCPEIDGGLSYVSCLTDAHSKTFRCLKGIESHPRFATCTHKPVIKKAMRDWYVTDFGFHKEVVKCLSTTTYTDKTIEKLSGVPQLPMETELDFIESSSTEEFNSKSTYNVDFGVGTKQCFYKLRKETSKCQEAASRCPKFNKCYIHPIIKTMEYRKHAKQAKFVKMLDSCLAGAIIPDEVVPSTDDSFMPDSIYPDLML
jgi:hypothetical protein